MKRTFPLAMTYVRYQRLTAPIRRHPGLLKALKWSNLGLALLFYICYPIALIWMIASSDIFIFRALLIPGISFVALSVFRALYNRPRPYEALKIQPLLTKETKGKSFPSRHIFSAFMIAATLAFVFPWGWCFFLPAALLAVIRVIAGVHYPSDVIAGAAVALVAAQFFYL